MNTYKKQLSVNHNFSINCRGKLVSLEKPLIMGILNLTPDSFSDGGQFGQEKAALKHAEKMISEGASIIDIGPQSTNPNSKQIDAKEETERLGKVISLLKKEFPETLISVDTFYAETVKYAADEGMDIINDISGGQFDSQMFKTAAETGLPYILMHINPSFGEMHDKIQHKDITLSINQFFSEKVRELTELRVHDIILDPGFGFGKTIGDQYKMTEEAEYFGFGRLPLLIGISRKSFIYKSLGKSPLEIVEETQKLHLKLLHKGAKILRVHDVDETKKTIDLFLNNY
ncbi:dihydropteroate synthase [Elizabethkingia miricola]|uniref:dihydropteroate synthase n=1 Tax=Elizabethkingia miricola TaxID=172045 RepID=UPI000B3549FC|nr:dihydropteroate synthase [Elizabethkingia miricola]NHQ66404.1 dihydropteroate synthase [Elizabethkingia miricola]NHQ69459.1 dihydropteroate synthase [Elizabethkingia miricola]NHQ77230.1 dihydropteroate synthase [Elizabethkingia miricola]PSL88603.1 dihydropteroate synthase [Elizabethkingia miricola]QHQ88059.1 dihydropteroate synthase [Elizabethkingia miricola]